MVKITGRTGQAISVEMTGIGEVVRRLRAEGKKIEGATDLGVVKAGAFIEDEVKESITGNRVEPKSVTTGLLANSIKFTKTKKAEGVVKPDKKKYPGNSSTTEDTAMFMEYGTSKGLRARSHFRNTKKRNENKVQDIIDTQIKNKL